MMKKSIGWKGYMFAFVGAALLLSFASTANAAQYNQIIDSKSKASSAHVYSAQQCYKWAFNNFDNVERYFTLVNFNKDSHLGQWWTRIIITKGTPWGSREQVTIGCYIHPTEYYVRTTTDLYPVIW